MAPSMFLAFGVEDRYECPVQHEIALDPTLEAYDRPTNVGLEHRTRHF